MNIPNVSGPNTTPKSTFWREQDFPGQATAFNREVDNMHAVLGPIARPALSETVDTTGVTAEVPITSSTPHSEITS